MVFLKVLLAVSNFLMLLYYTGGNDWFDSRDGVLFGFAAAAVDDGLKKQVLVGLYCSALL